MIPRILAATALLVSVWASSGPAATRAIILASTTSTENSGLLDHLLPLFERATGIRVQVVVLGTGQAIEVARNGDADLLLVHHKASEEAFVAAGYGVKRYQVMSNDFVLVGSKADPAGVQGLGDAATALNRIAAARADFVSRGDDSGTHKKEQELWQTAGIAPAGARDRWYREAGAGMGATLNLAAAMGAYALSDRATWVSFANKGDLKVLVEGDRLLFNPYGVILVNPARHPHVKATDARAFIDWLTGHPGQAAIAAFRINGRQLFFPDARPPGP